MAVCVLPTGRGLHASLFPIERDPREVSVPFRLEWHLPNPLLNFLTQQVVRELRRRVNSLQLVARRPVHEWIR